MLELAEEADGQDINSFISREFLAHHESSMARLNNGSFGCCPLSVQAAQSKWASLWLRQPDRFYFGPLQDGFLNSRRAVASLIHAHRVDQVVLVDNATVAVSMVLQKFVWRFFEGHYQKGDMVMALNFSYGSVKKALKAYLERAGAHLIEVCLPFPVKSKDEIVAAFLTTLHQVKVESARRVRLALIDHVTSMPSFVLPVKELVSLCRREGVDEVFVDGAHAIGNVDINVEEIGADYYTSNMHKWLFNPPSAAFLYCKPEHLQELHHPIPAHNYQKGLSNECEWVGTRDYSAQLTVVDAIEFFKKFKGGVRAVQEHNHHNVVCMGVLLADAWGTECGTSADLSSSMIMVGLPNAVGVRSEDDAVVLRTRLREEFSIEVPVYYAWGMQQLPHHVASSVASESISHQEMPPHFAAYVRISHQIYNSIADYEKLRDAVRLLVAENKNCQ
ncbi:hypothetical protein KP509_07G015600 [Ceratopteris richardii]|uniref:Aminotransferase class V domain-containing protein n=1 Tax=Ceratopteris richardii TaxID=49495 RepID=A0A8T2U8T3_CERRI|nr:hypothetical protein KP509_07G015600 [Ceratopteris richardii]